MAERDLQSRINAERSRRQFLRNTLNAGILLATGVGAGIGLDRLVLTKEEEKSTITQIELDYPKTDADFVKVFDRVSNELKKSTASKPLPPVPDDKLSDAYVQEFEIEENIDSSVVKTKFNLIKGTSKTNRTEYRDLQIERFNSEGDKVASALIVLDNDRARGYVDIKSIGEWFINGYNTYAKDLNLGLKSSS